MNLHIFCYSLVYRFQKIPTNTDIHLQFVRDSITLFFYAVNNGTGMLALLAVSVGQSQNWQRFQYYPYTIWSSISTAGNLSKGNNLKCEK